MNSSDSDEESAGMAYFLPVGIADDSPPKRSMVPPGSFGPIGGRTPTAAAGVVGGGFHSRSHSPPYLHLSAPAPAAAMATAAAAPPIVTSSNSLSNATSGSFRLADLGGEIHEPRAGGFGGAVDAAPSSIGAFGYGIGSFRSGTRSEAESAGRPDAGGLFGRASGASSAGASGLAAPFGGSAGDSVFGRSSASSGTGLFSRGQGELAMPSPFLSSGAQSSSPFGSAPPSWPPSSSTPASVAASASTNPRRVFQAPPGLGGPPMNSPRLGLSSAGGGDGSGLAQSRLGSVFGAFGAVANAAPAASGRPFSASLASPLASLNLSSEPFGGSAMNAPRATDRRRGITNPDLAELNSHSVRMQDAVGEAFAPRAARDPQSPDVKEVQSMKVDVQSRAKAKVKAPTPTSAPMLLDQGHQRAASVQTVKRVEKKKKQGLLSEGSPQSLNRARDVPASPASAGRVEAGHVKASTAAQLRATATPEGTAASAPRSAPAALSKKRHGQPSGAEAASSHRPPARRSVNGSPAAASVDAGYESSDSAECGLSPSAWESPPRTLPVEARTSSATERNDSSGARVTKKNAPRTVAHEKTPSTRRQVYREKQPKETGGERQRLASADQQLPLQLSSLDDLESPLGASGQSSKSDARDSKGRPRRPKVAQLTTAGDALPGPTAVTPAADKTVPSSSSFERSDSSDLEVPKRKKSPKQASKAAAADLETKHPRRQPSPQPSSNQDLVMDGNATADIAGSPRSGVSESGKSSSADAEGVDALSSRASKSVCSAQTETLAAENAKRATVPPAHSAPADPLSAATGAEETATASVKRKGSSPPNEEISPTEPPTVPSLPSADKKQPAASTAAAGGKEQPHSQGRKEKGGGPKRDKSEKKKGRQQQKKEKRESLPRSKGESFDVSDISDLDAGTLEAPVGAPWLGIVDYVTSASSAAVSFLVRVVGLLRAAYAYASGRLNVKGAVGTGLYHLESVAAVVFSVVLLLSLHGASWFIRIHRVAFRAILTHRHIGFCFAFLYAFPFLVQYVFPWAPPWAPVCLWYAFLVQLFCTNGSTAMVTTFRILLPLVFLVEGISHHSFLLDLNGAELLLASFILSAMKTGNLCSPIFFLSLAAQCLSAVFLGSELVVQWFQMALALYSLHSMVASEDDWNGFGDDDEELSCHSMAMHHSIADYSHHPAPSAASIQKTKRLDRRALAYVRGRKFR
ncbi:hypothetical protein PybrP1_009579 [[Pythium] brassicae (nom. inval.)]|nr:hypothetical protein PybrP1_009579 [[Pythium] brassicae (nom. inval.)]